MFSPHVVFFFVRVVVSVHQSTDTRSHRCLSDVDLA